MFSSLKYDFEIQVTQGLINVSKPILLGKIQVINANNGEEIMKNDSTILKGTKMETLR